MSMTTTSLSDSLPTSVPKLDATGVNWVIFQVRFQDAVEAKGFWGHFDGSALRPASVAAAPAQPAAPPDPNDPNATQAPPPPPPPPKLSADELAAAQAQWDKDERSAKSLLTQRIPDSTLIRVHAKKTVRERWAEIVKEFTEKGAYAQTDLRTKFLESRCPDKGNVREFLNGLRVKKEELASVGVIIEEKDYTSTIISSLPYALANYASAQLTAARIAQKTLSADFLISILGEEYDRQTLQRNRRKETSKSKDDKDEAMAVSSTSSKWKGGKGGGRKASANTECWNCGEKGHFKHNCPKPAKSDKGKKEEKKDDSPKKGGSANAAIHDDSESDGVWMATGSDSDSVASGESMPGLEAVSATESEGSMPDLQSTSSTDSSPLGDVSGSSEDDSSALDDVDWFSEVGDDAHEFDDVEWDAVEEDSPAGSGFSTPSFIDTDSDSDEVLVATEPAKPGQYAFVGTSKAELYDSGCTKHLSPFREDFEDFAEIPAKTFNAANKQKFSAIGKGEMVVDIPNGADISKLQLTEVLYSPEVGYTLISVGQLDEVKLTFGEGKLVITDPDGVKVGEVPRTAKGLYRVEHEGEEANPAEETLTLDQFHRRMGHISPFIAQKLVDNGFVTGVRLESTPSGEPFFCESCVYAKATRKSVPKQREGERAKEFGGEVHSDVWGPSPVESKGGKRYYITFTDDCTRLTHIYLLAQKSEAFQSYKDYEAWVDTQLGAKVKVLHSDRGGEYMGKEFTLYLNSKGTAQKLNVHDTPQHLGVAERRNRTIVERTRALLHASGLPKFLWGEGVRHVVWLMNRTSTKALDGMTPYEAAFGKKPDLRGLREWGEKVWVRVEAGNKLGGRVKEGRWIGVDERSKGVRVYWPETRSVSVERNVYYDETSASRLEGEEREIGVKTNADSPINPQPSTEISQEPTSNPTSTQQSGPSITENPSSEPLTDVEEFISEVETRPKRARKPAQKVQDLMDGTAVAAKGARSQKAAMRGLQVPPKEASAPPADAPEPSKNAENQVFEGEGMSDWIMVGEGDEEYGLAAEISEAEALEPRDVREARRRPDWPLWEKAIQEELDVLKGAGTWEMVDAPANANIVGSKWVFRAKKDAAGNVVRYKARLVAQGFSQVPGVDYFDTFAPVARLSSIRTVLAIAAAENLEIHQIDIKGAYLNGVLTSDEVIYMRQPPGYELPNSQGKVCRLRKTLYGLKQSGRRWYQRLVEIMEKLGFKRCEVDQAVFYRKREGMLMIVLVHVDDCTLVATTLPLITKFKIAIAKHVGITDLGELHWILGIEVRRIRELRLLQISQRSYLESTFRRYGIDQLKPLSLPMDPNSRLSTAQSPSTTEEYAKMRDVPYQEAVGSLMYASLGTRPDITYAVQVVSRFSKNPGIEHWEAVKRIFRYLKGTKDLWLSFGGNARELIGYADADGSMAEDRHAISGYAFILHGGAVSWSTKRQEIISLSTTESEYVAVTYASKEALWLRSLISQLFDTILDPTTLFSDNQSAIALTKDHQYHARTKHIDIRFHFIRWVVENGQLRLIYCPTDEMVADALTKALPSPKVKHFAAELGLVSV
ncbi:hypothetical protein CVT26_001384 [Gymnopilus dilepis]|uniref:Integrase catalytic domain-containing protein n=1 Tax=Gymnopilus dilepis TaxID=231916 RepID=A0A409WYQ1_9AGAR|nr:hypothetical protein CVT26_001384 [Gymnopilus dilepis]